MTPSEIKNIQTAIGATHWKLNLYDFAARIGRDAKDNYTIELFKKFQELNKAIQNFDAETLSLILTEQPAN